MARRPSRREQYSAETREALLTTAETLFADRGFARTALSEVASESGVTRGAVYHHFRDKQDLFRAVLERAEGQAMDEARDAYLAHDDPVVGAAAAIGAYLEHASTGDYTQLVLRQGPVALGWEEWRTLEEEYAAGLIEEIMLGLVRAGRLQQVPIETAASIAFTMIGGAALTVAGAPAEDRERVREESMEVLLRLMSGVLA